MGGTTLAGGLNPADGKFEARKPVFFFLNCPPPSKNKTKTKTQQKTIKHTHNFTYPLTMGVIGAHMKKKKEKKSVNLQ